MKTAASVSALSDAEWRERGPRLCFGCLQWYDTWRPLGGGVSVYGERCPYCSAIPAQEDALTRVV